MWGEKIHIYKRKENMQLSEYDLKDITAMFLFHWSIMKEEKNKIVIFPHVKAM